MCANALSLKEKQLKSMKRSEVYADYTNMPQLNTISYIILQNAKETTQIDTAVFMG